jgi:hypothetical protein
MKPITWLSRLSLRGRRRAQRLFYTDVELQRPLLSHLNAAPEHLPLWVQHSPIAMRYLRFLGPLAWDDVPRRPLPKQPLMTPLPYGPFLAACLVKVDQQIGSMARLREYLVDHPALTWALGFPLRASADAPWGFDVEASLPTHRHFTQMLRAIPNTVLQTLLDSTVARLQDALPPEVHFGHAISLDTKHILAWVTENNPKAYLEHNDRYDKTRQPTGDPDCRLGCKKKRNQSTTPQQTLPTPKDNPVPASTVKVGEWYWGYATGVVATKVPGWGEFVLAEYTQPFNCSDVSYFFPLMEATTRRLDVHPRYGALDAAFDTWYVHEEFFSEEHDGFAAVPFNQRGAKATLTFNDAGLPLCKAGFAMPLRSTFWAKTSLVPHEKGRYGCPLVASDNEKRACPIAHKNWDKGGCATTIPTSIGARLRYQLDRESPAYKNVYKQRTATERVNSQAVNLGIERPKLRNGHAIANHNTLIYIVINLRALRRVQEKTRKQPFTIPSEPAGQES